MDTEQPPTAQPGRARWPVVAGGIVALAVAMGVGRFAFSSARRT